eukprot:c17991_g1_i1.p1 GENE.c17991_g1_i1~~c17991_g1_i1.p1  ORF type:complete len:508 (+),score=54.91 c17991_g1_i1:767-2290(+)
MLMPRRKVDSILGTTISACSIPEFKSLIGVFAQSLSACDPNTATESAIDFLTTHIGKCHIDKFKSYLVAVTTVQLNQRLGFAISNSLLRFLIKYGARIDLRDSSQRFIEVITHLARTLSMEAAQNLVSTIVSGIAKQQSPSTQFPQHPQLVLQATCALISFPPEISPRVHPGLCNLLLSVIRAFYLSPLFEGARESCWSSIQTMTKLITNAYGFPGIAEIVLLCEDIQKVGGDRAAGPPWELLELTATKLPLSGWPESCIELRTRCPLKILTTEILHNRLALKTQQVATRLLAFALKNNLSGCQSVLGRSDEPTLLQRLATHLHSRVADPSNPNLSNETSLLIHVLNACEVGQRTSDALLQLITPPVVRVVLTVAMEEDIRVLLGMAMDENTVHEENLQAFAQTLQSIPRFQSGLIGGMASKLLKVSSSESVVVDQSVKSDSGVDVSTNQAHEALIARLKQALVEVHQLAHSKLGVALTEIEGISESTKQVLQELQSENCTDGRIPT